MINHLVLFNGLMPGIINMIDIIHKGALTVERLFYYTKFKIKKPSHFVVMATPRQYLISIQHFIQHLFAIQCYLLKVIFLKALLYRRFEVACYSMQPHNGDDGSRTRVQAYRHFNLYVHISTI